MGKNLGQYTPSGDLLVNPLENIPILFARPQLHAVDTAISYASSSPFIALVTGTFHYTYTTARCRRHTSIFLRKTKPASGRNKITHTNLPLYIQCNLQCMHICHDLVDNTNRLRSMMLCSSDEETCIFHYQITIRCNFAY